MCVCESVRKAYSLKEYLFLSLLGRNIFYFSSTFIVTNGNMEQATIFVAGRRNRREREAIFDSKRHLFKKQNFNEKLFVIASLCA